MRGVTGVSRRKSKKGKDGNVYGNVTVSIPVIT